MKDFKTVTISLGARSYNIIVGPSLINKAAEFIFPIISHQPLIVVTDNNVGKLHLESLSKSLANAKINFVVIQLNPGETTKNFTVLNELIQSIFDVGIERETTLLALGGGVVGDITGFAASVILRGINFIQIPTTLLAQVDSSVGGKTGINTAHGKNLVGSFYQPKLVLSDTFILRTLPRRQLLAGYAEIVKYGLLGHAKFFEWLELNGPSIIKGDEKLQRDAIVKSCQIKAEIVAEDERETGKRALLNLGHTFAHALEGELNFGSQLLHGEAVAIGMVMAYDLSARMGLCPSSEAERVRSHLISIGLPTEIKSIPHQQFSSIALLERMFLDKKVKNKQLTLVLARKIGEVFIEKDVPISEIKSFLKDATTR